MEDVLDLYAEPDDPPYPVVCFDESPSQFVSEARQPSPVRRAVAAGETQRNAAKATVEWRFPTAKARRKLKHIYPLGSVW